MLIKNSAYKGGLTNLQAFQVMKGFLNRYYKIVNQTLIEQDINPDLVFNDFGMLLHELKTDKNGNVINPAVWQAWLASIKQVLPDYQENDLVNVLQSYYITKCFLENYAKSTVADQIDMLLHQMNILTEWMNSISEVVN